MAPPQRRQGSSAGAPLGGRYRRARSARARARCSCVPGAVVAAMGVSQAVLEEALVVLLLHVVGLHPHAGDMDGLDVRRKAPVGLVDVGADVARARDHVLAVLAGLGEVARPEFALIDACE